MVKTFLRNVVSNWTAMFINIAVAFFMMPFVINELGNITYGFWALLQSLTSYMFLLDFGLRSSLNRHLAKFYAQGNHRRANQVCNAGLMIYLLVCLAVLAVSCVLAGTFQWFFTFPELDSTTIVWAIILIGSSVALRFPAAVFDAILTGLQRYDLMNIAAILSLFVRTALIMLSLKLGYALLAMALATFLASLLHLLLSYTLAVRVYPAMRLDLSVPDMSILRILAHHGLYAYILIGATRIITDAGNVILAAFVGAAAVTFYSIAASLTTYATNVISGISTTIPPAASDLEAKGDHEGLKALCIRGTKFVLLAGLPVLLTFILTGDTFIRLWIGEDFYASYPLLVLLSIAWAFNYLQSAAACVLIGLSRHKMAAWLVLAQAILNLGLSLFLVRPMGMLGVAWGALTASVIMNLVFQVHALRLLGISGKRFLAQAITPAAIALIPFVLVLESLSSSFPPSGLLNYFLHVAFAVGSMLIFLPWFGLNRRERHLVWGNLRHYIPSIKSLQPQLYSLQKLRSLRGR
jgi:O-antigen/teichoic acid export membrane protein